MENRQLGPGCSFVWILNTIVYFLIVEIVLSLKRQEIFFSVDNGLKEKTIVNRKIKISWRYSGTHSDTKRANVKQTKEMMTATKKRPRFLNKLKQ